MAERFWVLVVESCEADRSLIETAVKGVAPHLEIRTVDSFREFVSALAANGSLPTVAILDWHAPDCARTFLESLGHLGIADRFPMVATARQDAMAALDESFQLGVPRFVCKLPDDATFKKKIAEAIADYVPGAKKVLPPLAVLER